MVAHRAYLVRFAQRKLHDPALAEDVVHDVFEAVLRGRAAFAGARGAALLADGGAQAQDRRPGAPAPRMHSLDDEDDDAEVLALECPQPRPDELAEQRQRLCADAAAHRRAAAGPARRDAAARAATTSRPKQVCQALQISEENLFVRLHRARKQLLT